MSLACLIPAPLPPAGRNAQANGARRITGCRSSSAWSGHGHRPGPDARRPDPLEALGGPDRGDHADPAARRSVAGPANGRPVGFPTPMTAISPDPSPTAPSGSPTGPRPARRTPGPDRAPSRGAPVGSGGQPDRRHAADPARGRLPGERLADHHRPHRRLRRGHQRRGVGLRQPRPPRVSASSTPASAGCAPTDPSTPPIPRSSSSRRR